MNKVLFILKRREDYNGIAHSNIGLSTGLYNSASFMDDMLNEEGIDSKLVVVVDNNCIDREVTAYKPTHVIIEALWVVPSKFDVLQKLHPDVKWIIRLHSELPFIANEGMAIDWICDYASFSNVYLGVNAPRMLREAKVVLEAKYGAERMKDKLIYLPNFYPQFYKKKKINKKKEYVDVACFGAIRPLKNQLAQAIAAIEFAEKIGKKLRFHINAGRIEMKGDSIMNNLRSLFEQMSDRGHEMINHQWTPREQFLKLCSKMDIGMQCSFSETFNIVGADLISQGIPLVGSSEIPWSSPAFNAAPTETQEITKKLLKTYKYNRLNTFLNRINLKSYTNQTKKIWSNYFKG
jgi:hypothetical protein